MATTKSLKDLSGEWKMDKKLSSDPSPILGIQGFGALVKKSASLAPVDLSVRPNGDSEIYQSTTANLSAIKEEWYLKNQECREPRTRLWVRLKAAVSK
ncbi:hypothetical protein LTR36_008121 [Oleoguttula mirabilis]|uniref:Uncharacterized protein n=1 Tax=Oleoguttula mirabilis TaxID=1507867 RepID=A0AAV9J915_9PEZI|nr:hypothetical protein LTR36_008121 [Oleoguttula mirabilis]